MEANIKEFLSRAYDAAAEEAVIQRLEHLAKKLLTSEDAESILEAITEDNWRSLVNFKRQEKRGRPRRGARHGMKTAAVAIGVLILILVGVVVVHRKPALFTQMRNGTYTPTPTVTSKPTLTPTPTTTLTPTPTVAPTATPIPPSSFLIDDIATISPPVPAGAEKAWLVNEVQFNVSLGLDNTNVWVHVPGTPSAPETQGDGYVYSETGNATISWEMDVPLGEEGMYGVYVLDTQEHSVGEQIWTVLLDGAPAEAFRGQSDVFYADEQESDQWLSLGFYDVAKGQRLGVRAEIASRTKDEPFALDKLLIIHLSADQADMLRALPSGRTLAGLWDDDGVPFFANSNSKVLDDKYQGEIYTDVQSWGNGYRSLNLTGDLWEDNVIGSKIYADWPATAHLSAGEYELYVWIPEYHATAVVEYTLLADGKTVERETRALLNQKDHSGWVSLGIWELPEDAVVNVRILIVKDEQMPDTVEIGLDAVAILRVNR